MIVQLAPFPPPVLDPVHEWRHTSTRMSLDVMVQFIPGTLTVSPGIGHVAGVPVLIHMFR